MTSVPFSVSTAQNPGTFFVFKPQATNPTGNVYNDWSALYNNLLLTSGSRFISFDGTDDSFSNIQNCSIPTGTWDMTGVTFQGLFIASVGQLPVAQAEQDCVLQNLVSIGNTITVTSVSTNPVVTFNAGGLVFFTVGTVSVINSDSAPFISVTSSSNLFIILGADSNITGSWALDITGSSAIFILGLNNSALDANSVQGDGSAFLELSYTVGSAILSSTQGLFSGTLLPVLNDLALGHFYDNTLVNLLAAVDVQNAIDELATNDQTNVANAQTLQAAVDYVTMTTGGNHTIATGKGSCRLHATGTITAYTLKMPASPLNGQLMLIATDQIITTFTLQANTGQAFVGTPVTTLALASTLRYEWISTDNKWWPV